MYIRYNKNRFGFNNNNKLINILYISILSNNNKDNKNKLLLESKLLKNSSSVTRDLFRELYIPKFLTLKDIKDIDINNKIKKIDKTDIIKSKHISQMMRTEQDKIDDFNNDIKNSNYIFKNGLRYVVPYNYIFHANSKQRWFNRKIIDILSTEFRACSHQYFINAINNGKIKIRDAIVTTDYLFKSLDWMTHEIHKHEPPVIDTKIQILYENKYFIAINKPPSIPVHPCGKYRANTVIGILAKEYNIKFFPVHRLDKLTSGTLILAKDPKSSEVIMKRIEHKGMDKIYYARVLGKFPEKLRVSLPISLKRNKDGLFIASVKQKAEDTPIESLENIENYREAISEFELVSYNGHTSLIKCYPITGRTHQLRMHLMSAGFPIANDRTYGGKFVSSCCYSISGWLKEYNSENDKLEDCDSCEFKANSINFPGLIWLHAWKYATKGFSKVDSQNDCKENDETLETNPFEFSVEAPLPDWANDNFDSVNALIKELNYSLDPVLDAEN